MPAVDDDLIADLHREADAGRWDVTAAAFGTALEQSAARCPAGTSVEHYLRGLHLRDLALSCACAAGHEGAWEHFVREIRPVLYRAAAAIDRSGGDRDLADSIYGELFGVGRRGETRTSLFRYFHGRSSLATWLRAILSQRHIDRIRDGRRWAPLPEEDGPAAPVAAPAPEVDSAGRAALVRDVLRSAVGRLPPRDRLRLGWYYAQDMTLAQIGRVLKEHEATVSRHLSRARRAIREDVERQLQDDHGMGRAEIDECFASLGEDAGTLDLDAVLDTVEPRKRTEPARSTSGDVS